MYGYHNVKWLIMSEAYRNGLKDRGYAMKDHFSFLNSSQRSEREISRNVLVVLLKNSFSS